MPYSAGTIILQVVPSYLGFQDANEKMAKDLARSLDESLEKGATSGAKKASKRVNEILGDELGKDTEKQGEKAADKYAGSFRTSLENAIKKMEKELKPIELRTASDKTLADLATVKAALNDLSKTKIEPGMDTRSMERDLSRITGMLADLKKNSDIDVKWDVDEATRTFEAFKKKVDSYKPKIEIPVEMKTEKVERQIGSLEKLIKDRLSKAGSALGDSVDREIQQIKARLATLGTKQIGIDIDAAGALSELRQIEIELAHISATTVDVQVHADATEALVELKAVDSYARRLNGLEPKIKPKVDTKDSEAKLGLLSRLLKKVSLDGKDVANSFRFFSFAALAVASVGAALVPILAALAGGAIALGTALVAAVAGGALLAVAFSGIKDAVSALNDQQDKAGKTAEDNAKKMKSAAQQVEDAQRSLARARTSAAESIEDAERSLDRTVVDAAKRQQDAARQVADAREASARAIESALKTQQDAEERLADSQRDAAQAQKDLVQARVDAQKELEDLQDKQKHNELDQRQAVIDLFNATVENNAAAADPGATNLEKEQADINLKNAQLRLKELRDSQKEMDKQAKKGVNNSDQVKNAQDRVTDALKDQKKAQEDLADADKNLTRTRLDNARSIQDALDNQKQTTVDNAQAVEDAQRNLARTQASAQQSIGDAQRNLQRAQESYNESLNETDAAAEKVREAMENLGPAGQKFAIFLHNLVPFFHDIRDAVQEAFLPPLQEAMTLLLKTYGPELKSFASTMGGAFGDLAKQMGEVFTNKDFQTFFKTIGDIAPILTKNFGTAFLNFFQAIANIAVAFAPLAVDLSEAFADWSESFLEWTQSKEGQKTLQNFLDYVKKNGPAVAAFLLSVVGAIVNLAKALAPYGEKLLDGITNFLNFIANMDPKTLGAILASVLALVAGFQALAGAISLLSIVISPIGLIVLAVFALVAAFVYLYNTNDQFAEFINRVWPVIQDILVKAFELWVWWMTQFSAGLNIVLDVLGYLWHNYLEPFLAWLSKKIDEVWKAIKPALKDIADLFSDIGSTVFFMWNKVVWPILKVLGNIVWQLWMLTMKPALDGIGILFKSMGATFKFVWDHVLSPVFGWIMDKLGVDTTGKEKGGGLVGAFRTAVSLIKTIWDNLKEIAKGPIDFIVGTVINKGLIDGFNGLSKVLPGLKPVDHIPWPPPGFANGGIPDKNYGVRFGYSPGRDNQLIAVGGGEAILRPEATRALGSNWVNAVNKRAKLYGVQGVANLMMGFKNGGEVSGGSRTATPNEFARTKYHGKAMDWYTLRLLQAAERIVGHAFTVTQGSYSTSVAASGSTHAGGGALDLGWIGKIADVAALRAVGFAAWHRNPSQGPWHDHIHAIAAGDPTASASAKRQVQDYFNGGNGLGGRDDGPNVKKDPSLLNKIGGALLGITSPAAWVVEALTDPNGWLHGKITGQLDKLTKDWGDNSLTQTLKAIPEKLIKGLSDMISGGIDAITPGGGGGGPVKDMVKNLAQNVFGWSGNQWNSLDWLVQHESSWNPNAKNPSSSAYGLFQFLDGTWGPYGPKTSDPKLQAQYGMQYIKDRYGDPAKAKAFWEAHHWYADGGVVPEDGQAQAQGHILPNNGVAMYDNGGYLPPGVTTVVNLTGKPEPVFTAKQFEGMRNAGGSGDGLHYEPHFYNSDLTADDVMDEFRFEIRRLGRGS